MERPLLAIDFGTSNTVVAAGGGGDIRIVELDGRRSVPSVLYVEDDGEVIVGGVAEALVAGNPGRGLRSVKTLLGQPTPVVLAGGAYRVADLVAKILGSVYRNALDNLDIEFASVCLAYPADWSRRQMDQFRSAASKADLPNPRFIAEPLAAAFGLAQRVPLGVGSTLLVYDLGGGTFDTAVVRASEAGLQLVGRPRGDRSLGGDLLDEALWAHVGENHVDDVTWGHMCVSDEEEWLRAAVAFRAEIRRGKELLSRHPYANLTVASPGGIQMVRLGREEAFEILRPFV